MHNCRIIPTYVLGSNRNYRMITIYWDEQMIFDLVLMSRYILTYWYCIVKKNWIISKLGLRLVQVLHTVIQNSRYKVPYIIIIIIYLVNNRLIRHLQIQKTRNTFSTSCTFSTISKVKWMKFSIWWFGSKSQDMKILKMQNFVFNAIPTLSLKLGPSFQIWKLQK